MSSICSYCGKHFEKEYQENYLADFCSYQCDYLWRKQRGFES